MIRLTPAYLKSHLRHQILMMKGCISSCSFTSNKWLQRHFYHVNAGKDVAFLSLSKLQRPKRELYFIQKRLQFYKDHNSLQKKIEILMKYLHNTNPKCVKSVEICAFLQTLRELIYREFQIFENLQEKFRENEDYLFECSLDLSVKKHDIETFQILKNSRKLTSVNKMLQQYSSPINETFEKNLSCIPDKDIAPIMVELTLLGFSFDNHLMNSLKSKLLHPSYEPLSMGSIYSLACLLTFHKESWSQEQTDWILSKITSLIKEAVGKKRTEFELSDTLTEIVRALLLLYKHDSISADTHIYLSTLRYFLFNTDSVSMAQKIEILKIVELHMCMNNRDKTNSPSEVFQKYYEENKDRKSVLFSRHFSGKEVQKSKEEKNILSLNLPSNVTDLIHSLFEFNCQIPDFGVEHRERQKRLRGINMYVARKIFNFSFREMSTTQIGFQILIGNLSAIKSNTAFVRDLKSILFELNPNHFLSELVKISSRYIERLPPAEFSALCRGILLMNIYDKQLFNQFDKYILDNWKFTREERLLSLVLKLFSNTGHKPSLKLQMRFQTHLHILVTGVHLYVHRPIDVAFRLCLMGFFPRKCFEDMFTPTFMGKIYELYKDGLEDKYWNRYFFVEQCHLTKNGTTKILEKPKNVEDIIPYTEDKIYDGLFFGEMADVLSSILGGPEMFAMATRSSICHKILFECLFKNGVPVSYTDNVRNKNIQRVAILYLNKSKYFMNQDQLKAYTTIKIQHLEANGYTVIQIPYFEWDLKSKEERTSFLRHQLSSVFKSNELKLPNIDWNEKLLAWSNVSWNV